MVMQLKSYIFIKNALILTATSIILRTAGIVFRIYLASAVGSEGMGLYQLCISVFVLGVTFATVGISTAVTRLVAENEKNGKAAVKRVMNGAFSLTFLVSALLFCLIFFFSKQIATSLLGDERLSVALKCMSPSFAFVGFNSCMRGYFIAKRKSAPPSVSQIFEEAVRITVIVMLLTLKKSANVGEMTAIIMLGDTVSEGAAAILLFILYKKDEKKLEISDRPTKSVAKELLRISLPLSFGKYVQTGLHTAENILVPSKLSLFSASKERGLSQFGAIKGMAIPILFFPASLLTSFSTLLIPEISNSLAESNWRSVADKTEKAISITLKFSILAAVVFFFCGEDIGNIIYKDADVGYIIKFLAPIVPFMYLESVSTALLKGLDQQMKLFWFNCIDSAVRVAAIMLFVSRFGINGFLGIMTISNIFTSTLTIVRLIKVSKMKLKVTNWILKPVIITVVSGLLASFLTKKIEIRLIRCTVCAIIIVAMYLFAFFKENNGVMSTKPFRKLTKT